jgi:hypothetical protein
MTRQPDSPAPAAAGGRPGPSRHRRLLEVGRRLALLLGGALRRDAIRWGEEPREIRAIFPPTR